MQTETPAYKRIVLKLSGEAVQERGGRDNISPTVVREIAERIKDVRDLGVQVAELLRFHDGVGGEISESALHRYLARPSGYRSQHHPRGGKVLMVPENRHAPARDRRLPGIKKAVRYAAGPRRFYPPDPVRRDDQGK